MHIIFIQPKVLKILTVKLHTTGIKHCQYICTKYSHKFQQNRLIFLLGANRPGAKRLGGRNDQGRNDLGRNAAGAKRLGGELDLGRNDPDSLIHTVNIRTTHPRKTSSPLNFCNIFDTSVSSLCLKMIILCFGSIGLEPSKQIPSLFTFLRRVSDDQSVSRYHLYYVTLKQKL